MMEEDKELDLKVVEDSVNELVHSEVGKGMLKKSAKCFPHSIQEYDTIEDNFMRYRAMVDDALELYEQAREMAAVSDTGLSASIYRMAEPFRKGHFTLAIVGKMNAGKSTFINALLGNKDLLPTGFFQTTCTITTILHNEKQILHVIYGDEREETIEENIGEALSQLVAIEPQYKELPVNNLNRLILNNKSPEEICSERRINELEDLSRIKIDINTLKDYLAKHPKEKIPMQVVIECPLCDNYRGWRIVDTPGVDAVGGIEDDTRKFLCRKDDDGNHDVDAIIFVQPAKNDIESDSLNKFVSETIGNLTDEARKRSFFVLTHASNPDFIARKDEVLNLAKQLFVDFAHVGDNDRLIAVDSLASILENDQQLDFKALVKSKTQAPAHWDPEIWKDCRILIKNVKSFLEDDDEVEFNNENARNKLHELANFDTFRNYLNEFVKIEKQKAFIDIISLIERDIKSCITIKEQDIIILQSNLGKSPKEFIAELAAEKEKLDKFQLDINLKFAQLSQEYSKSKVDEEFKKGGLADISPNSFKSLPSLKEMRKKAETSANLAEKISQQIKDSIIKYIDDYFVFSQKSQNFTLPPIDYKAIASNLEKIASEDSDRTRKVRHSRKKTTTGLFIRYRLGKLFGKNLGGEEVWYETVHETDMDAAAMSFCENLRKEIDDYRTQIAKELENLIDGIDKDIKKAIKKRKNDYDKMAKKMDLVNQIKQRKGEIGHLQKALAHLNIYLSIK